MHDHSPVRTTDIPSWIDDTLEGRRILTRDPLRLALPRTAWDAPNVYYPLYREEDETRTPYRGQRTLRETEPSAMTLIHTKVYYHDPKFWTPNNEIGRLTPYAAALLWSQKKRYILSGRIRSEREGDLLKITALIAIGGFEWAPHDINIDTYFDLVHRDPVGEEHTIKFNLIESTNLTWEDDLSNLSKTPDSPDDSDLPDYSPPPDYEIPPPPAYYSYQADDEEESEEF